MKRAENVKRNITLQIISIQTSVQQILLSQFCYLNYSLKFKLNCMTDMYFYIDFYRCRV